MTTDLVIVWATSARTVLVRGPRVANLIIRPHGARFDRRARAWRLDRGHVPDLLTDLHRAGFRTLEVPAAGEAA